MRRQAPLCVVVLTGLLAGCTGYVGEPGKAGAGGGGQVRPSESTGDPDLSCEDRSRSPAPALRRLTSQEGERTLEALLGSDVLAAIQPKLDLIQADDPSEGFSTMVRAVNSQWVNGQFEIAVAAAEHIASSATRRAALHECLEAPTDSNEAPCVEDFVRTFGRKVFRRPVTSGELASLVELFNGTRPDGYEAGVEALVSAMLLSPAAHYHLSLGDMSVEGDQVPLTAHELAERISYLSTGAPPDATLAAAADSGALLQDAELAEQVERLFSTPQAESWVTAFFGEWLRLGSLPGLSADSGFLAGLPTTDLTEEMRDEMERFLQHVVFTSGGGYQELMTSRQAFFTSPALGTIYGVDPGPDLLTPVMLPEQTRSGIFTRAAFLALPGEETAPIKRGARVLERFLCVDLEVPDASSLPPGVEIKPPDFDATKTSRDRWTQQTSQPACAGCHMHVNPPGFALESYDSVGRHRTKETIIDPSGKAYGELPIDPSVTLSLGSEQVPVEGGTGLGAALAESEVGPTCVSKQWLRFAYGRHEEQVDVCAIEDLTKTLQREQSLTAMFKRLALTPEFRAVSTTGEH